jgi:serine/threonine protein kinase
VSREFGRRFGRYETLFRIAGGGMAEVYAARIVGEGGFQKVVALKRMLPTLAEDERFVTMFLDEGRVAANISSPNVVQTLDLGRADDDSLYLVMELVVGVSLGRLVRGALKAKRFLSPEVAAKILAGAARGLHDAHEATTPMGDPLRIIHRDVSPQNILVDRAGRTRITDFGVARAMQRHSHTQTGEMKGKMAYFAPEQAVGGELDRRLDVFALGIVAWEVLCGRRLFKGDNPLMTLKKITEAPVPSIRTYRSDVPEALDEAVQKALQRDREDRWPTALDFARALEHAVGQPASTADVAEHVKAFGGAPLEDLDRNLKLALSGEFTIPEPTVEEGVDDAPTVMERTPLSTSAIVPTGTGNAPSSTTGTVVPATEDGPPKWLPIVAIAAVAAIAAGGGAFFALSGGEPEEPVATPLEAAPTETAEEEAETEEATAAAPVELEADEEPEAELTFEEGELDEEPEAESETAPATMRRARRRATSMRAAETTMSAAMAEPEPEPDRTRRTRMSSDSTMMSSSSMLLLEWGE